MTEPRIPRRHLLPAAIAGAFVIAVVSFVVVYRDKVDANAARIEQQIVSRIDGCERSKADRTDTAANTLSR